MKGHTMVLYYVQALAGKRPTVGLRSTTIFGKARRILARHSGVARIFQPGGGGGEVVEGGCPPSHSREIFGKYVYYYFFFFFTLNVIIRGRLCVVA